MTEERQEYGVQVAPQVALQTQGAAEMIEKVLVSGDLSKLTAGERVTYYRRVCESIGVNPFTKPFDYITLNGKLTLYAKRDATDQLRDKRRVSIVKLDREKLDDIYVVTAYAKTADGRQDSSIGAVSIGGLKGDAMANAMMKAETKAKRRVTLSIVGLGWLDETEVDSIPDARPARVDDNGNMETTTQAPKATTKAPAANDHTLPLGDIALVNAAHAAYTALQAVDKRANDFWLKRHLEKRYCVGKLADMDDEHLTIFTHYASERTRLTEAKDNVGLAALQSAYDAATLPHEEAAA